MTPENFKPHKMYHPKTGKSYRVNTYDQHLRLKGKGYGHRNPAADKRGKRLLKKRGGY